MNLLLLFSFLCITIGLGMVFWHSRNNEEGHQSSRGKQNSFATEMLTELEDLYPDIPFEYHSNSDMIAPAENYDGGRDYKFYLGNLRNRSRDMGKKKRKAYIREMIMTFTDESEITTEELKSALYLRARTKSELALRHVLIDESERKGSSLAAIQRGDIVLETVRDMPNGVRIIDQETLKEHALEFEEAFNIAATNLLRVTPDNSEALWEKVDDDIWISKLNDDYDAARIFTFPEQMHLPFTGTATVYAPAHAILLVTPKQDENTLERMVEFGNNAAELHRPLSNALWSQTETGWGLLTSTNRSSIIWQAALADETSAYAEQKTILEQIFEKDKKDVFVASVIVARKDDGDIYTTAVFIGHDTYLPKVDQVVLQTGDPNEKDAHRVIEWNRFVDILGPEHLKAVPQLIPKRFYFDQALPDDIQRHLIENSRLV